MTYFKISILFLCILFTSESLLAQSGNKGQISKKYRSVFLGFGPRTLNTDPGTILTEYTDESPSMDYFQTSVDVEDSYTDIGMQLGYMWGKYAGLSHSLLIDVSLGANKGGAFTYSLGYTFPVEIGTSYLVLRPAFFVGFGNYGFKLGEINNNAAYIEINGEQYYDEELGVSLTSQVGVFGPELDLRYLVSEKVEVFVNGHYNLTSKNSRPKVEFESKEEGSSTSLEIDSTNPNVTYNGEKLTTLPYDIAGLRLTVGAAYVWPRSR